MSQSLVSIITPCYNSEQWIVKYLESIYHQTYKNIQLICVNDGSIDNTEKIIMSYLNKFRDKGMELTYVYQENEGLGSAINTGLKYVEGEYFTWCDSDNFYESIYVELKVEFFEKHLQYDIVRCDGNVVQYGNEDTILYKMADGNTEKYKEDLFYNALLIDKFHFGCAMLRTEAFDKINPTREIYKSRAGQNWQLLLPMFYHYKSGYIDKPLFWFVIRDDSISNKVKFDIKYSISQNQECINILKNTIESMDIDEKIQIYKMVDKQYLTILFYLYIEQADFLMLDKQYMEFVNSYGCDIELEKIYTEWKSSYKRNLQKFKIFIKSFRVGRGLCTIIKRF